MREAAPQHNPSDQPPDRGGRFGMGVVPLAPGEFKGDPRRVLGHPSNPNNELGAAFLRESSSVATPEVPLQSAPSERAVVEQAPSLEDRISDALAKYPQGVLVKRSSGAIVRMMISPERTQRGVDTQTGQAVERPVAEGSVLVRDEKGDTRIVRLDGLDEDQQRLESVVAAQRQVNSAMSEAPLSTPEQAPPTREQLRAQLINGMSEDDKLHLVYYAQAMDAVREAQQDGDGNASRQWQSTAGFHYQKMSPAAQAVREQFRELNR